MEWFNVNDVLSYFFGEIATHLSAGSPTADVYTSEKQRVETTYTATHGAVTLFNPFGSPVAGDFCGPGMWAGGKVLLMTGIVLAESRFTAHEILARLENLVDNGKFQDTSLPSPAGPSPLMYTGNLGYRRYQVDSELYGLQIDFDITFWRVMR